MKFLSTEEGRVGVLAGVNLTLASVGTWVGTTEAILRLLLLLGQLMVAWLTALYIYRKVKNSKKDDE